MASNILELHGGSITITSGGENGLGNIFVIEMPMYLNDSVRSSVRERHYRDNDSQLDLFRPPSDSNQVSGTICTLI